MNRHVLFRCEATLERGGGHLARCAALAHALARGGWRSELNGRIMIGQPDWMEHAFQDRSEMLVAPDAHRYAAAVFDNYELAAADEAAWQRAGIPVLAIDDVTNRPHDCEWLLNPSPNVSERDFAPYSVVRSCYLLGPRHTPMHPSFFCLREDSIGRRRTLSRARKLFLCLGLTDPMELVPRLAAALLAAMPEMAIEIAISAQARSAAALQALALQQPRLHLHLDANNIAALMASSDLAVCALGTMTWERCTLGLPGVSVLLADNQLANAASLTSAGIQPIVDVREGCDPDYIATQAAALAASAAELRRQSDRMAALCDGLGAFRTALAILPERTAEGRAIHVSVATEPGRPVYAEMLSANGTKLAALEIHDLGKTQARGQIDILPRDVDPTTWAAIARTAQRMLPLPLDLSS